MLIGDDLAPAFLGRKDPGHAISASPTFDTAALSSLSPAVIEPHPARFLNNEKTCRYKPDPPRLR